MKHRQIAVLAVTLLGVIGVPAVSWSQPKNTTIVIAQPESPVQITTYSASYSTSTTYSPEGVQHSLAYTNKGASKVVAIEFGLVSFDAFNDFLNRLAGISMDTTEPGKQRKGSWISTSYGAFSFWTGIAYVQSVRLEDGTIWEADPATILAEMRKIQKDFDAKLLTEGKGGSGGQ